MTSPMSWWSGFNQVDMTYRSGLHDMNDANFIRFETRLEQGLAKIRQEMAEFRGEMRSSLAELKAELIKWMFLFWVGTALTVIGIIKF